jgi:hypothetical protein
VHSKNSVVYSRQLFIIKYCVGGRMGFFPAVQSQILIGSADPDPDWISGSGSGLGIQIRIQAGKPGPSEKEK